MFFHFQVKAGPRGSASNHISYITRKGSYGSRGDLVATAHGNLPAQVAEAPETFWQAADRHERKNAAPFRAYTLSLPNVLSLEQLVELAKETVQALAGPKPHQLAVHAPTSSLAGEWNPHVHAVISDRVPDGIERPLEQIFRRYNPKDPSKGGWRKDSGGKPPLQLRDDLIKQRKLVADLANAALKKHGHKERVDHRSLAQQGVRRKPERHLGPARVRTMATEDRQRLLNERARHALSEGKGLHT